MASPIDLIRLAASRYPEAEHTTILGDHEVFRVKEKVFVWLGDAEGGGTYVGVKLKETQAMALMLPGVTPMAYGMGKWGWIGATFPKGKFPEEMVKQWIDESYRHTAPKKLLKALDAGKPEQGKPENKPAAAPKKTAVKKPAAKRPARKTAPRASGRR
jgi:predicted DNA-binding protein (MmcQ/YjbR family)